jgi:membrane-associated PAP2 superfamily phosphatase
MYQSTFIKNIREYQPKFWLLHLILPLLLAIFMLFLYPSTGLDALFIQPYYDANSLSFPLKQDWFLETIMHTSLKYSIVIIALGLLLFWILGLKVLDFKMQCFKKPCFEMLSLKILGAKSKTSKASCLQIYHQHFLWVFVAMLIATTAISILKHMSNHACPWSLSIYGGNQPLLALFETLPIGAAAGHCFPGGHASGGFALMAFYFGFKDTSANIANIKLANLGLLIGLLLGFAMGWAQMMRGAHFMSHNLWTAWIVWMLLLVQYLLWKPAIKD